MHHCNGDPCRRPKVEGQRPVDAGVRVWSLAEPRRCRRAVAPATRSGRCTRAKRCRRLACHLGMPRSGGWCQRGGRGQVLVDGQDLTTLSEHDRTLFRRARIGFVFQFFNLIPTLTVGENVSLPLELNRMPRLEARKKAQQLLNAVGLLDRWNTFPEKLSGGEQQRVALARALVHDPLLILADEPTGNLDEETGAQMMLLLTRLTREQNGTLLIVTHSPEATSQADHVLRLSHGQLVEER